MKHKLFLFIWLTFLAFLSVLVGVLALLEVANAEVIFWTNNPIESNAGKIAWIVVSAICAILFSALAVREYRSKNAMPPR